MTAAFIFGLIAFAAVMANLALRDHRRALGARRRLFDDCLGVLEAEHWSAGGDGFPALEGRAFGTRREGGADTRYHGDAAVAAALALGDNDETAATLAVTITIGAA